MNKRMAPNVSRCAVIVLAGLIGSATADAQDRVSFRFGNMELAFDGQNWRADRESDTDIKMEPIGDAARRLDSISLKRIAMTTFTDCLDLARMALWGRHYEPPAVTSVEVAKLPAVRLAARARCRNAMPEAVALCVHHRGSAYVLTARKAGCFSGGNNLFSGIDPLYEIAMGLRALD